MVRCVARAGELATRDRRRRHFRVITAAANNKNAIHHRLCERGHVSVTSEKLPESFKNHKRAKTCG